MTSTARFVALVLTATALAACTVPVVGHVGGGPLPLDLLAVSAKDPDTGNTSYQVNLKWSTTLGTKTYEILRKFGDQPLKVLTSTDKDSYVDTTLAASQAASYKVRALGDTSNELKVSEEKSVTMLAQTVAAPTGLDPADNATVAPGDLPTLKWAAVPSATFYYVRVSRVSDDSTVFSAMTKETSIKFGDKSPLAFEKFGALYGVGTPGGIQKGVVHRWTVKSMRTDGSADPATVKAIDVNTSTAFRFSQGG